MIIQNGIPSQEAGDENEYQCDSIEIDEEMNDAQTTCSSATCDQEYDDDHEMEEEMSRVIVQDYTPFSESLIWELMMKFYDNNGVSSWADGIVPYFVSSNAFIGKSYAKLISAFLMDLESNQRQSHHKSDMGEDQDDTFYIVEVGGGTGKLAFHILQHLAQMRGIIDLTKIVYVLTDFTESNIQFWEQQSNLKPFVDSGRLDFALFEAIHDDTLTLRSGKILKKGDIQSHMCIIANYLIDTLCHDLFQIEKGMMKQGLVSVGVRDVPSLSRDVSGNIDCNDSEFINNLINEYKYEPIDAGQYYESIHNNDADHLSHIMSWYENHFKDSHGASILIPIGFLKAIRNLTDISSGKALIITGDKGNANPDYFRGLSDPHFALHGSFSLMVNFHAISLYIQSRGGFCLNSCQDEASLQVNGFVLNGSLKNDIDSSNLRCNIDKVNNERKKEYPFLSIMFEECVDSFTPNDFYVMQNSLQEEADPSLVSIISLTKLSNWDPDILYKFRENILSHLPSAGLRLRNDLEKSIKKLWNNYYHLGSEDGKDVVFEIGRLCFGLSLFEEALYYYHKSLSYYGDHYITYHNIGLCNYSQIKFEEAKLNFSKALELKPDYSKSKSWLGKVEQQLIVNKKLSAQPFDMEILKK